jgi:hypothetical protein
VRIYKKEIRKGTNTKNDKMSEGNPRECVEGGKKKGAHDLKLLEGMEEANKRNDARKFYTIAHRMKAGFQP